MKKKLAIIGAICFVAFVVFGTIWVNSKGDKMVQLTEYGRQVAFLEEHEEEMTEFVKSQDAKIESVKFDWNSVGSEVVGNGTPQGGGNILTLRISIFDKKNVKINAFGFAIKPDNISNPKVIKDMYTINANYNYFEVK